MYNNLRTEPGLAENSEACQMEMENGQWKLAEKWGNSSLTGKADRQDGRKWAWSVMSIRFNRKSMLWCLSLHWKRSRKGWYHMQKVGVKPSEPYPINSIFQQRKCVWSSIFSQRHLCLFCGPSNKCSELCIDHDWKYLRGKDPWRPLKTPSLSWKTHCKVNCFGQHRKF